MAAEKNDIKTYKMYINGEWVNSSSDKTINVMDPSKGTVMARVQEGSPENIKSAIDAAKDSFEKGIWSRLTPSDRSRILLKIADIIESKSDELSRLESMNSGKSIKQASNYDLPYTVDNIRFLAGASGLRV